MRVVTRETAFHHGIGLPPGEVVPLEEETGLRASVRLVAYGPEGYVERVIENPAAAIEEINRWPVCWIHVSGVGDQAGITRLCEQLKVHALAVEDILNTEGRPKVEEFDDDLFVLTKGGIFKEAENTVYMEQLTFYMTNGVLLSVQESDEPFFDPVRRRVAKEGSRIRQRGVSYLMFALMDVKNDLMLSIVDEVEDDIVAMEQDTVEDSEPDVTVSRREKPVLDLELIYRKKRTVLALMRILLPIRDNANRLELLDHPLIAEADRFFYRDLADSTRRAVDRMDHHRIILQTMQEFYHLEQEHRTNEVMKVLTIIATLFLPLTFIAGLYGMNFDHEISPYNMPELYWKYGYFFCLGFMALIFCSFLVYFRRKKWI